MKQVRWLKELTLYYQRQDSWVKRNKVRAGDKVVVARKEDGGERFWPNVWVEEMDEFIGKVSTVQSQATCGISLSSDHLGTNYYFPYFCLKTIKTTNTMKKKAKEKAVKVTASSSLHVRLKESQKRAIKAKAKKAKMSVSGFLCKVAGV